MFNIFACLPELNISWFYVRSISWAFQDVPCWFTWKTWFFSLSLDGASGLYSQLDLFVSSLESLSQSLIWWVTFFTGGTVGPGGHRMADQRVGKFYKKSYPQISDVKNIIQKSYPCSNHSPTLKHISFLFLKFGCSIIVAHIFDACIDRVPYFH